MDKELEKRLRDAMERHGYDEFEARLYLLGALALNTEAVRQVLRDARDQAAEQEREECARAIGAVKTFTRDQDRVLCDAVNIIRTRE